MYVIQKWIWFGWCDITEPMVHGRASKELAKNVNSNPGCSFRVVKQ